MDQHGLQIQSAAFEVVPFPSTPEKQFVDRKVRYTIGIGYRRITRETTCDRLSLEIATFLSERKAILVGIDGINGFECGPTEQELGMFAHPFEGSSRDFSHLDAAEIGRTHQPGRPSPDAPAK